KPNQGGQGEEVGRQTGHRKCSEAWQHRKMLASGGTLRVQTLIGGQPTHACNSVSLKPLSLLHATHTHTHTDTKTHKHTHTRTHTHRHTDTHTHTHTHTYTQTHTD